MDAGVLVMSGLDPEGVLEAVRIVADIVGGTAGTSNAVVDYKAPNVSHQVAKLIASYTGFVRRVVWRK